MIGSEYGIKGKNTTLLNGWDKIRRDKDIIETFAAARVGTGVVGAMPTSDRVTEIVLGDYAIEAIDNVANAFLEDSGNNNGVIL